MESFFNNFFATGVLLNLFRKAPITQLFIPPNPYAASRRHFYEASYVKQKYRKFIESHPTITVSLKIPVNNYILLRIYKKNRSLSITHFYEENWFESDISGSTKYLESNPALANLIAQPVLHFGEVCLSFTYYFYLFSEHEKIYNNNLK